MSTVGLAWAAGMVAGLGVLLLLVAVLPDPPPDLAAALTRLDGPHRDSPAGEGWVARAGRWLALHTPSTGALGVPVADLRLLESRKQAGLADVIAQRTLLSLAVNARRKG